MEGIINIHLKMKKTEAQKQVTCLKPHSSKSQAYGLWLSPVWLGGTDSHMLSPVPHCL